MGKVLRTRWERPRLTARSELLISMLSQKADPKLEAKVDLHKSEFTTGWYCVFKSLP